MPPGFDPSQDDYPMSSSSLLSLLPGNDASTFSSVGCSSVSGRSGEAGEMLHTAAGRQYGRSRWALVINIRSYKRCDEISMQLEYWMHASFFFIPPWNHGSRH